jgi:hypothetical protein
MIACATQKLAAVDYVVSGEQSLQVVQNSVTSIVQTVSFTLTRVGTNWSICNTYTKPPVQDTVALVDGRAYSMTHDLASGESDGLVMDKPLDRLDASPEFTRMLLTAFLISKERWAELTNSPVGFLWPRHPALHCYRWDVSWSAVAPFLADRIRFHLDQSLVHGVSDDAIRYYFRSGYGDRRLFKRFQETQRAGADYSVANWTNWNGASFPLKATLSHTRFDHSDGQVFPQMLVVTVTAIARPDSESVVPPLTPGAGVQHIVNGTSYYYTSADGKFLSPEEAIAVGRVLIPAPPQPGGIAAFLWMRSHPWQCLAFVFAMVVALLVGGALVWFAARLLKSRK